MVFSPDQTFVDVIHLTFKKTGITVGHKEYVNHGDKMFGRAQGPEPLGWGSIVYRWIYLQLAVSTRKLQVYYVGETKPIVTLESLQSVGMDERFKIPKFVYMSSVVGTIMAGVDEVNVQTPSFCTEGVINTPTSKSPWSNTWGLIPVADPQPGNFPPLAGYSQEFYNKI